MTDWISNKKTAIQHKPAVNMSSYVVNTKFIVNLL